MEYSREREDRKVCGQQMKQLYLECSSGISGDMTVAALLDLGADQEALKKALDSLPVDGFETRITRVKKSGLDACDFDVVMSTGTITTSMPMAMGMYIGACGRYGRLLKRQI